MKKIAIMQPTFMPWIGYFGLMEYVDEFVYLDNIQFDKRSWQQRNRIKTPKGEQWITVPVSSKSKSQQRIMDAELTNDDKLIRKITTGIEQSYKKAEFYEHYAQNFLLTINKKHQKLMDLNTDIIDIFRNDMQIKTPIIRASNLKADGEKANLLANICKELECKHYISPPGSKPYIDASDAFENADIEVEYFNYNHPKYRQLHGDFIPYMSTIDLFFNEGPKSREIMREGIVQ